MTKIGDANEYKRSLFTALWDFTSNDRFFLLIEQDPPRIPHR